MVHASGNAEESEYEIRHWFGDGELCAYERAGEAVMF
jgi:hypothetical protein